MYWAQRSWAVAQNKLGQWPLLVGSRPAASAAAYEKTIEEMKKLLSSTNPQKLMKKLLA
jgi:hypothetical protein